MKGMVRIGKIVPNPFTESGGDMKEWYHVKCIFEKLDKARATTKKIEDITDLEGWEELQDEEKETINKYISGETRGSARVTYCFQVVPEVVTQLCLCHEILMDLFVWLRNKVCGAAPILVSTL